MAGCLLQVRSLAKTFAGTQALSGINLDVNRGRVLAVVGENGAGKSTLGRILAGEVSPDRGELLFRGERAVIHNPKEARRLGIFLVHQELSLCDNLTIGANLFLGCEPLKFGLIDHRCIRREAQRICGLVRLDRDPEVLLDGLSIADRQKVEIGRALVADPQLLILDEPTSSLAPNDVTQLLDLLKQLKSGGLAIIYITHKFWELSGFADEIAVLRDGRLVASGVAADMPLSRIVSTMSRVASQEVPVVHTTTSGTEVSLRVKEVRTAAFPRAAVSFDLRCGEIVGLSGPDDGGRSMLLDTVFGLTRRIGGEVFLCGQSIPPAEAYRAAARRLAFVPGDRRRQGVVLELSVGDNLMLPSLPLTNYLLFDASPMREYVRRLIGQFAIRPSDETVSLGHLSGGNQQKVVLAKWLGLNPIVLLMDNPTRGVDLATRHQFYRVLEGLSSRGVSVLFTSSEPTEIRAIADRVLIMVNGQIIREISRDAAGLQSYADHELVGG